MSTATETLTGRIEGLQDAEYRAADAVSCSLLKEIYNGGCAAYGLVKPKKTTAALAVGAALHIATTRPDAYEAEVVHAPGDHGYGKRGTAALSMFSADNPGKIVILDKERKLIEVCAHAARSHPKVRKFLEAGTAEVSYFADDPDDGARTKCRVDWEKDGGKWCIDFKFMESADERAWMYSSRKYHYYLQDAFYRHVIGLVRGKVPDRFTFVVTDKTLAMRLHASGLPTQWAVAIYEHEESDLDAGAQAWRDALALWTEYKEADRAGMGWAGFPDRAQTVQVIRR